MSEELIAALNKSLAFRKIPPLFYIGMAYPDFSRAIGVLVWADSDGAANATTDEWNAVYKSLGIREQFNAKI